MPTPTPFLAYLGSSPLGLQYLAFGGTSFQVLTFHDEAGALEYHDLTGWPFLPLRRVAEHLGVGE